MCKNWPHFPISVDGATGGLIGNTVLICGGYDGSFIDECYSLTSQKRPLVTHMSVARDLAVSIVLNDNTLWVTGGFGNGIGRLVSTEYVTISGTIPGPDLPMALTGHAMVTINSTCSMVIGGYGGSYFGVYASTFYYEHLEGDRINGPSLIQARRNHAAGIVTDEVTNENHVAVTGGNYVHEINDLDSVEILQDGKWVQGKINDLIYFGNFCF